MHLLSVPIYYIYYIACIPIYRKMAPDTFDLYPNFDYLGDIQDKLLEMDGKRATQFSNQFSTIAYLPCSLRIVGQCHSHPFG